MSHVVNPLYLAPKKSLIKDQNDVELVLENGNVPVAIQDQHTEAFVLYLYKTEATPTLTQTANIGDTSITVDDTTDVSAGDALTIIDGGRVFQAIVTDVPDVTHIEFTNPLDYGFDTGATVETGPWNLNLNGASTPITFDVHPPTGVSWDLTEVRLTIRDNVDMDSAKFGGIAQLDNGLVMRVVNGITKNHAVIINNLGFYEHGFEIGYDDKAPAGSYGFRAKKCFTDVHGVTLRITDDENDAFQAIIQDDLTDLTQMVITILGHLVLEN